MSGFLQMQAGSHVLDSGGARDAAIYLKSDDDIAHYLEAAFEDGDPSLVAAALGDVARAKGMAQIAQAAGLGRESCYKALSKEGILNLLLY